MFAELSEKLSAALGQLRGRGVLTEEAIRDGLEELRRILLEADVGFDVARDFAARVGEAAVGLLGEQQAPIRHASVPPTVVFLVGLQGSGKTTTAAKLARRLQLEQKAPFLVAADVYRPGGHLQL